MEWFGQAGHFICANRCRFHLHTHVEGGFCVSTVGEFYERPEDLDPTTVGVGRLYETMVFRIENDGDTSGEALDTEGYNDQDAANIGHMKMIRKWSVA